MSPLLLSLAVLQAPAAPCAVPEAAFTMPLEEGEEIEAEVYLPCEGETADRLLEALIERDNREISEQEIFKDGGDSLRIVGLERKEDNLVIAYALQPSDSQPSTRYVCRISGPYRSDTFSNRPFEWCLTYIFGSGRDVFEFEE